MIREKVWKFRRTRACDHSCLGVPSIARHEGRFVVFGESGARKVLVAMLRWMNSFFLLKLLVLLLLLLLLLCFGEAALVDLFVLVTFCFYAFD